MNLEKETKLIEFSIENYKYLCEEMREVLRQEKELEAKKESLRQEIIQKSGGNRMEYGIKVTHSTCKGTIDYKKCLESLYDDKQLFEKVCEQYRKQDVNKISITSY